MTTVSLDIAQKELPDLIEDVVLGGHVVITKENKPVAQILPVSGEKQQPLFGSAKGLLKIGDNFEDPINDFAEYTR